MMKNTNKFGAFAAMFATAVMCAHNAWAVDWSQYRGKTYTVPADTTNEVSGADYAAVNAISTIVFENEHSALLVTTSAIPNSVKYQGPGSVIFPQKVVLGKGDTVLRRTLGAGDANNFVKFVLCDGMETYDGVSKNFYYWYNGSYYSDTNATFYLDGQVTNITFRGGANSGYNGRFDFGEHIDLVLGSQIASYAGSIGVIRQRGGKIFAPSYYIGQTTTSYAAYLLEGGSLTVRNGDTRWYAYGPYLHFRQTGGTFYCRCWQRPDSVNDENSLPSDFIYGGNAVASCAFEDSTPMFIGSLNVAVMDNAQANAGWLAAGGSTAAKYTRNVAINGGTLTMDTRSTATNTYYSFNGGTLKNWYEGGSMFGNNAANGNTSWIRIYERGGCIYNANEKTSDSMYLYLPFLREPVGNVVWSIAIPEGHELETRAWQTPPSVEIYDDTGAGAHAAAVVDYDFDTGRVTNITVICRGEGYTEGHTFANLRYKAGDGNRLLSEALVCEVGPCTGGDMTFAGGKTIYVSGSTNEYHGATIVDMDREGEYDHPAASGQIADYHSLFLLSRDEPRPRFLNTTNIIVKSGDLICQYDGESFDASFPSCRRIEFYGGHFANWSVAKDDVVIGGETWLTDHGLAYISTVTIPATGTLTVDYGSVKTNDVIVTPTLKYGYVTFESGAKVSVKNLDTLPRGRKTIVLDLSNTTVTGTPALEDWEDGVLSWNAEETILYARRHADGMFLIFR